MTKSDGSDCQGETTQTESNHSALSRQRFFKSKILLAIFLPVLTVIVGLVVYWFLAANGPVAPSREKWPQSVAAFDALIKTMPSAPAEKSEWVPFEVPNRVGSYDLQTTAYRVQSGAIFYDTTGTGLLDDAGFAYLPNGPDASLENGSFESPQFKHLGGPWYSWGASW